MQVNDLIKLADLLDANGEYKAADEIGALIVAAAEEEGIVLSPETIETITNSVQNMNKNIEQTIEFLKDNGYHVLESDEKSAESLENVFDKLADVADRLDSVGAIKEADRVDGFLGKYSSLVDHSKLNRLVELADKLDSLGMRAEADLVDGMIRKQAGEIYDAVDWKEGTAEDPYDYRRHHNMLVKEPKKDQERTNFEGYGEPHLKTHEPTMAHDLGTRYCPDHIGYQMGRVGEGIYQCPVDGKTYDRNAGYVDYDGNHIPGGSVAAQTPNATDYSYSPHRIFDTRELAVNKIH